MPEGGAVAIKPPGTGNTEIFAAMGDEQVEWLKVLVAAFFHGKCLIIFDAGRTKEHRAGKKFQPEVASQMQCSDKKNSRRNANMSPTLRSGGDVDGGLNRLSAKGFSVADGAEFLDVAG